MFSTKQDPDPQGPFVCVCVNIRKGGGEEKPFRKAPHLPELAADKGSPFPRFHPLLRSPFGGSVPCPPFIAYSDNENVLPVSWKTSSSTEKFFPLSLFRKAELMRFYRCFFFFFLIFRGEIVHGRSLILNPFFLSLFLIVLKRFRTRERNCPTSLAHL